MHNNSAQPCINIHQTTRPFHPSIIQTYTVVLVVAVCLSDPLLYLLAWCIMRFNQMHLAGCSGGGDDEAVCTGGDEREAAPVTGSLALTERGRR